MVALIFSVSPEIDAITRVTHSITAMYCLLPLEGEVWPWQELVCDPQYSLGATVGISFTAFHLSLLPDIYQIQTCCFPINHFARVEIQPIVSSQNRIPATRSTCMWQHHTRFSVCHNYLSQDVTPQSSVLQRTGNQLHVARSRRRDSVTDVTHLAVFVRKLSMLNALAGIISPLFRTWVICN